MEDSAARSSRGENIVKFFHKHYPSLDMTAVRNVNSSKYYRIPCNVGKSGIDSFDQLHNFLEAIPSVTTILCPTHNKSLEE
jgi:putative lipoic acid-binding regulatory protein